MGVTVATIRASLNTGTGTQDFTTTDCGGLTPKAALFILTKATADNTAVDDALISWGITDGTRNRCVGYYDDHGVADSATMSWYSTTNCIQGNDDAGTAIVAAAFSAWITNGVTINITTAPAGAWLLTVVLFCGTDLSAYAGHVDIANTVDNTVDVTAPGFEPHVLLTAANDNLFNPGTNGNTIIDFGIVHNDGAGTVTQRSVGFVRQDSQGSANNGVRIEDSGGGVSAKISPMGNLTYYAEYHTFDASGFSISARIAAGENVERIYLALKLAAASDATVFTYSTPTATGNASSTAPGFQPQFLYGINSFGEAVDSAISNANSGPLGISVVTPTVQYSNSANSEDAAATMNTQSLTSAVAMELPDHTGGAGLTATLTSMDATGFTLNYSAVEAAAKLIPMLAIKSDAVAAVVVKPKNVFLNQSINRASL